VSRVAGEARGRWSCRGVPIRAAVLAAAVAVLPAGPLAAWPSVYPTGTTVHDRGLTQEGFFLYASLDNGEAGDAGVLHLVDTAGRVVHRWRLPFTPLAGKLLADGNVVVIGRNTKGAVKRPGVGKYHIGGASGWLVELDWQGELVFKHVDLAMHHDFAKLPDGHYLYLAWEPVPESLRARIRGGIKGTEFEQGAMFNDKLVEIDATGRTVWEWHANDAMDADLDIVGPLYRREEWYHGNSLWPLADGRIALTGRFTDSLLVVDRGTGGIVFRFGSPSFLDAATGRIEYRTGREVLGGPHDVREIPAGYPGAGNLTLYDNGTYTGESRVVEIDRAGRIVWQWSDGNDGRKHYSFHLGGAQRLRNGNTFVCDGANGRCFQVTPRGRIVWEYVNPHTLTPRYQAAIFKAEFYEAGHCPQLTAGK